MKPVKIVEIGAEGGSITLYGWLTARGNWRFQTGTDESTLKGLLSAEDAAGLQFTSSSPAVSGWKAALRLLSRYPWKELFPLYVHPEFANRVMQEVERGKPDLWLFEKWSKVCRNNLKRHTVCFSHGKESGPWGEKISRLAKVAGEMGYAVVSIDYRKESDPDVRLKQLYCEFQPGDGINVLVGSSMGGYVAAVASRHFKPDGLFLMAPAFGIKGYREQYPEPCAGKVSIVHGLHDDIVPCRNSMDFSLKHHAELHLLNDGHQLLDSIPLICDLFRRFLDGLLQTAGK